MEKTSKLKPPRCIIIAGPNGAGKTTFAREFLPREAGIIHFVNADLLAAGLSPLRPEAAALAAGYRIEIFFLKLHSPKLALHRIATRVKQGGHNVGRRDVLRRFDRSSKNFEVIYKALADSWELYDNSEGKPQLLGKSQ